jgi:glycosyltransferase involved in cell wall biosynthesis
MAFRRNEPKLNVVLPAHNEAGNLEHVVASLMYVAPEIGANLTLTIVNDGSTDDSASVISTLQRRYGNLRCITHLHRAGYGAAVASGLKATDEGYAAIMDADGQFEARDLARLFEHTASYDVVVGYRIERADPAGRKILGRLWSMAGRKLFRIPIRDLNCGLKIFHHTVLQSLRLRCSGPGINMEIMSQIAARGIPILEVGCRHHSRTVGQQSGANLLVIAKGVAELARLALRRGRAG